MDGIGELFAKMLLVPGCVSSAGKFSGYFLVIVNMGVTGDSSKIPCRNVLGFTLQIMMVYILLNWSGGEMWKLFWDERSIDVVLDNNIYDEWLRAVSWSEIILSPTALVTLKLYFILFPTEILADAQMRYTDSSNFGLVDIEFIEIRAHDGVIE